MKPKKTRGEKFFNLNKVKYYIKNASPRKEYRGVDNYVEDIM